MTSPDDIVRCEREADAQRMDDQERFDREDRLMDYSGVTSPVLLGALDFKWELREKDGAA